MLIFHHCNFQLSSLCNWPSSWVCPVYDTPLLGVKSTSSMLWTSANFCSISQNMHYKTPVASQHWKTNKVVWTWKDDWPPCRTSTYERPFTNEGNYLVLMLYWQPLQLSSLAVITYGHYHLCITDGSLLTHHKWSIITVATSAATAH